MNFLARISGRMTFLGEGRTRRVFLSRSGKYVVKIPLNGEGEHANFIEARDFSLNRFLGQEKLARCREVCLNGKWCLVMERVYPASIEENLPSWADFVDCRQVGYTRRKNLVAYDWAS